jgi:hypothetical protein
MESHEHSEDEELVSVPGHPGELPFQPRQSPTINLPPFWADNAAAWFALAESRFRMKRIYDEWDRYDAVVSSLSKENLRMVLDLVTSPPRRRAVLPAEDPPPRHQQPHRLPEDRAADGNGGFGSTEAQ